ncbi:MAG: hypothetical protein ACRERS_06120 [Methylococcales bacterium]
MQHPARPAGFFYSPPAPADSYHRNRFLKREPAILEGRRRSQAQSLGLEAKVMSGIH